MICPPWPRSGSSSVYAAQAETYRSLGCELAVVVAPHSAAHRARNRLLWETIRKDFSFAQGSLYLNRSEARIRRRLSVAYWDWIRAGRDSVLAIEARYAARTRIDSALIKRIRAHGVALIHVNHAFNMGVAQGIAALAQSHGFARPKIILETHDVQAQRYARGRMPNYLSGQMDLPDHVTRDETRIAGEADALIHICEEDVAHFERLLPDHRHFLLRPTTRNQQGIPGNPATTAIDFLFVGNAHGANVVGIQWFIEAVMPLVSGQGHRIRIAGSLSGWFRDKAPALHALHPDIWLDEQPDIAELYRQSRFVIVPTTLASGASIKLIEALAMGKHVVATPMALKAFDTVPGIHEAVRVAGNAAGFAAAMQDLSTGCSDLNQAGLAIYDRHFSNDRYRQSLLGILRQLSAGVEG